MPRFYLHKWEMFKGKLSLMVELPADARSQKHNEDLALLHRESDDVRPLDGSLH